VAANVINKMNDVVDLFLTRSHVREMLRAQAKDKSVFRLIPTRFLSAVIVAERLLELKMKLITVVDSVSFTEYMGHSSTKADVKA